MRFTMPAAVAAFLILISFGTPARAQQDPCIGQLMLFGGQYCPRNYTEADGKTLDIGSNSALFSILGTTYGGNGTSTFAVPDLRGRAPVGQGQGPNLPNYSQGQLAGSPTTTLTTPNLPAHSHDVHAYGGPPTAATASGNYPGTAGTAIYNNGVSGPQVKMATGMIGQTGSGTPATTQSPVQAIRWCVAVQGIYCSRP